MFTHDAASGELRLVWMCNDAVFINRKFVAQRIGKPIIEIYIGIERLGSYVVRSIQG